MFQIGELSRRVGLPTKTIRYYEGIGLLVPPTRADNDYRLYTEQDVERLRFIRSARSLDFSLEEIARVLTTLDRRELPCNHVVDLLRQHIDQIEERIRDLETLRNTLTDLYTAGKDLPEDIQMQACVCHLIKVGVNRSDEHV